MINKRKQEIIKAAQRNYRTAVRVLSMLQSLYAYEGLTEEEHDDLVPYLKDAIAAESDCRSVLIQLKAEGYVGVEIDVFSLDSE